MTNTTQNQIKEENTPETTELSEDDMQNISGGKNMGLKNKIERMKESREKRENRKNRQQDDI